MANPDGGLATPFEQVLYLLHTEGVVFVFEDFPDLKMLTTFCIDSRCSTLDANTRDKEWS